MKSIYAERDTALVMYQQLSARATWPVTYHNRKENAGIGEERAGQG